MAVAGALHTTKSTRVGNTVNTTSSTGLWSGPTPLESRVQSGHSHRDRKPWANEKLENHDATRNVVSFLHMT